MRMTTLPGIKYKHLPKNKRGEESHEAAVQEGVLNADGRHQVRFSQNDKSNS